MVGWLAGWKIGWLKASSAMRGRADAQMRSKAEDVRQKHAMNPSVNEWFMVGGLKAGKDGGRWTEGSRR